jgi:HAD superfamily hydrolase (TIGR01459 family)
VSFWDRLPEHYRVILCDVWGVVHDGAQLYPFAAERLLQWKEQGRAVIVITNAPRTCDAIERQLARIGLPRDAFDAIASAGEAGIAALSALHRPVGFLGTHADRAILEGKGVQITNAGFANLACTGLEEGRPEVGMYREELERWAAEKVWMHCLNPDRVVIHRGVAELCAGAIADAYVALGGEVIWYGKPFAEIYRHALQLAGAPPTAQVLAVGDGLQTDMLGAARMGFDAVFVSGGIGGGKPFPDDFAERNGLGDWRPIATVEGLA